MKQTLLFVSALLYLHAAFSQTYDEINSLESDARSRDIIAKNNIVEEKIYGYYFNKEKITDSVLLRTAYYDSLGDPVQVRINAGISLQFGDYRFKTDAVSKYLYKYDSMGKLKQLVSYDMNFKSLKRIEYDYDSAGNEEYKYDYQDLSTEFKVYNEKRQLVKLFLKLRDVAYYNAAQYFYDPNGELSREDHLDRQGKAMYSYYYRYSQSSLQKTVDFENDLGRRFEAQYIYNQDRQCIKKSMNYRELPIITDQPDQFNNQLRVDEYSYNADKTLYEWRARINNKRVLIIRHFYFRKSGVPEIIIWNYSSGDGGYAVNAIHQRLLLKQYGYNE